MRAKIAIFFLVCLMASSINSNKNETSISFLSEETDFSVASGAWRPIDWRDTNCITMLIEKGNLQNTIPQAIVSAIESNYCITKKMYIPVSIQQLIDCVNPTSQFPEYYQNDIAQSGLYSDYDYPYVDKGPKQKCKLDSLVQAGKVPFQVPNWTWEYPTPNYRGVNIDANSIYLALQRGPLIVGFNFYQELFSYTGGIMTPATTSAECGYYWWGLLVGYGVEGGREFWIVKGYDGLRWGERGFFKLARNDATKNYGISCGYRRPVF